MARYTGASCRQCRREGMKLFLKGERCYTDKCAIVTRNYAPGQHGQGRKKVSGYGLQLREKQKVKRIYGVLETQFRNLYERADKMSGMTGVNLLSLLLKFEYLSFVLLFFIIYSKYFTSPTNTTSFFALVTAVYLQRLFISSSPNASSYTITLSNSEPSDLWHVIAYP